MSKKKSNGTYTLFLCFIVLGIFGFEREVNADVIVMGPKSEIFVLFSQGNDPKWVVVRECPQFSVIKEPSDRENVCSKSKAKREIRIALRSFRTRLYDLFSRYQPVGISKEEFRYVRLYRKGLEFIRKKNGASKAI